MAYIRSEHEITRVHSFDGVRLILDETLERLEHMLPPESFFRLNRQYIASRPAIKALEPYFNGRMIAKLDPDAPEQVFVSKEKAPLLKRWLLGG
jgi:DNA-binding LytR/AlgR family response regulator